MAELTAYSEEASTGESLSLITYYNYIKAWNIAYNQRYDSEDAFKNEIRKLASKARPCNIPKEAFDKGSYIRGVLTLQFMSDLPVDAYPKLTFTANIWLPVHSYYAIHGIGLALLRIRKQDLPKKVTHKCFRSTFTDAVLRKLFPYPFNGLCAGGPLSDSFVFRNINTTATKVKTQRSISDPAGHQIDDFIGKSLSTTRKRMLEDAYNIRRMDKNNIKPGHTRCNIDREEKEKICKKLNDASICDFIYRMRCRSNYDDPIMYLSGTGEKNRALSHYKELLHITEVIIEGIDTLIEFYLGKNELGQIKQSLDPFKMTEIDDIPF